MTLLRDYISRKVGAGRFIKFQIRSRQVIDNNGKVFTFGFVVNWFSSWGKNASQAFKIPRNVGEIVILLKSVEFDAILGTQGSLCPSQSLAMSES